MVRNEWFDAGGAMARQLRTSAVAEASHNRQILPANPRPVKPSQTKTGGLTPNSIGHGGKTPPAAQSRTLALKMQFPAFEQQSGNKRMPMKAEIKPNRAQSCLIVLFFMRLLRLFAANPQLPAPNGVLEY
jgi:hypothetical protein